MDIECDGHECLNCLGNVPVFSDAFIILTSVNSVAVKVVFSSHVGSTSSGQHFVEQQAGLASR